MKKGFFSLTIDPYAGHGCTKNIHSEMVWSGGRFMSMDT
jgi:hypothetical protein